MKREDRQHGFVRSYVILPTTLSQRRYVKTVDSASIAGSFTKVSRKPTNQSKFTGKCGKAQCLGCHIHPATKSKDKTKGTMKLRSIGSDHGLIGYPAGTSATSVLAYLASQASCDDGDDYDYDYYDEDANCSLQIGNGLASTVAEEQIGGEDKDEDEDTDEGWYLVGHNHHSSIHLIKS